MDRGVYRVNLQRLRWVGNTENEYKAALVAATPHIGNPKMMLQKLDYGKSIALPSVLVQGAFWRLSRQEDDRLRLEPDRVLHGPKGRKDTEAFQSGHGRPAFLTEASNYAERNWPCSLKTNNPVFSGWFELCDPAQTGMGELGGCKPITAGCATFRTGLEYLKRLDPNQRRREFNRSIIHSSVLGIERDELRGPTATLFRHCIRCGHWLQPDHCPGCKMRFPRFQVSHTQEFFLPDCLVIGWQQRGQAFARDPSA